MSCEIRVAKCPLSQLEQELNSLSLQGWTLVNCWPLAAGAGLPGANSSDWVVSILQRPWSWRPTESTAQSTFRTPEKQAPPASSSTEYSRPPFGGNPAKPTNAPAPTPSPNPPRPVVSGSYDEAPEAAVKTDALPDLEEILSRCLAQPVEVHPQSGKSYRKALSETTLARDSGVSSAEMHEHLLSLGLVESAEGVKDLWFKNHFFGFKKYGKTWLLSVTPAPGKARRK